MATTLYIGRTDAAGEIHKWASDNKVWALAGVPPHAVYSMVALSPTNIFIGHIGGSPTNMKISHWDGQNPGTFTDMTLPGTSTQTSWDVRIERVPGTNILWARGSINGGGDCLWRCLNADQGAGATWTLIATSTLIGNARHGMVAISADLCYLSGLGTTGPYAGVLKCESNGTLTWEVKDTNLPDEHYYGIGVHPVTGELWICNDNNGPSSEANLWRAPNGFGSPWVQEELFSATDGYPLTLTADDEMAFRFDWDDDGQLWLTLRGGSPFYRLYKGDPTGTPPNFTRQATNLTLTGDSGSLKAGNGYALAAIGNEGGYYLDADTGLWAKTNLGNTRQASALLLDPPLSVDVPLGANYVDGARYDDPSGCVDAINQIPQHGETDVKSTTAIKLHLVSYLNAEIE